MVCSCTSSTTKVVTLLAKLDLVSADRSQDDLPVVAQLAGEPSSRREQHACPFRVLLNILVDVPDHPPLLLQVLAQVRRGVLDQDLLWQSDNDEDTLLPEEHGVHDSGHGRQGRRLAAARVTLHDDALMSRQGRAKLFSIVSPEIERGDEGLAVSCVPHRAERTWRAAWKRGNASVILRQSVRVRGGRC